MTINHKFTLENYNDYQCVQNVPTDQYQSIQRGNRSSQTLDGKVRFHQIIYDWRIIIVLGNR